MDKKDKIKAREAKERAAYAKKIMSIESARKTSGLKPLEFGRSPNNVIVAPSNKAQNATYKKQLKKQQQKEYVKIARETERKQKEKQEA